MYFRSLALATLALALFATVPSAHAEEPLLGPADYLKILTESKLRYNVNTKPAATPVTEMDCGRRFESTRVTGTGDAKKLIDWVVKPEAVKLLDEAEALFQAKKYAEAGEKYQAAAIADPEAVNAYLFYGDSLLFGKNDAERALAQYRKGIALDPTLPMGHLYASTALTRLGRLDEAREEIIQALVDHPAYEAVWKILAEQPTAWGNKPVVRYKFEPPAGYLGVPGKNGIDMYAGSDLRWLGYVTCKAVWANEARFSKSHVAGGWSLDEERACVLNQVQARYNTAEGTLEEAQKKKGIKKPDIKGEDILAAMDPLERHILEAAKANMLDGYIVFEIIGQHCPISTSIMVDEARKNLEAYIRTYVLVPLQ